MQIVIDTNIVISGILTNGAAALFMDKVFGDYYDVVVTENILKEYDWKLHSPKFGFQEDDINFVLSWFRENAMMVEVDDEEPMPFMDHRDATDKVFYWAAKRTGSLLVTGNIKHYPVEEMRTMLWELN